MKPTFPGFIVLLAAALMTSSASAADTLQLHLRSRTKAPPGTQATVIERQVAWDPKETALIIEHAEKYWCPSFTSTDLTGKSAFRFMDQRAGGVK